MAAAKAPPASYTYAGGDPELDALLAAEDAAKAAAEAATERLKELNATIKARLTSVMRMAGNGAQVPFDQYEIRVPGQANRLLVWRTQRRVSTAALKAALPDVYAAYSAESGTWKLERVK